MSLGSRIVQRGRAAILASAGLSSTPGEPLLFLYPRWFTAGATAVQHPAVNVDNSPELRLTVSRITQPGAQLPHPSLGGKIPASQSPRFPRAETKSTAQVPPQKNTETQETDGNAGDDVLQPSKPCHRRAAKGLLDGTAGGYVHRVVSKAKRRAARKAYEQTVRQDYQDRKLEEHGAAPPDWRAILLDLEVHTPTQSTTWHHNAIRILVPVKATGRLLFSQDDNIWAIKSRYDCQIEISDEVDEDEREYRAVLLSGPVACIAKAAAEILRIIPEAVSDTQTWHRQPSRFNTKWSTRAPRLEIHDTIPSAIRLVRSDNRRIMAIPKRADRIPRPSTWTSASFGNYVQHLTSIKMSKHLHGVLYKPGEHHCDIVIDILHALFMEPECQGAISAAAFNDAISYLIKHNQKILARDLLMRMETLGLKMNTETFNIMLRGAAKSKDLHAFHFIIRLMLLRGYAPNASTWLAFIMTLDDFQIKLYVLAGMKNKGLFHVPGLQKSVCEHLVSHEIEASLDKEIPLAQFLHHMADCYGENWLTVSSAHRILDSLGSRGLISRCWEFFQFMVTQGVRLDTISINTILHHCEQQRNEEDAVEILRRISTFKEFTPDEITYNVLFNIAWNSRLYTVARVVWRYACLDAATTFRMRKRVRDSLNIALSGPTTTPSSTIRGIWNARAGSFILGGPSAPFAEQSSSSTPWHFSLPSQTSSILLQPTTQVTSPKNTRAIIAEAVRANLRIFRDWIPKKAFVDVLVDAWETDKEWTTGGARYQEGNMEWLAERAPAIPLVERVPNARNKEHTFWK